jgi:hypothetical protein
MEQKHIEILEALLKRPYLTAEERETLSALIQDRTDDKAGEIELDLSAVDRAGPDADGIRLCVDFGTAMSKAWA